LAEQLERYRWLIVGLLAVPLVSGILFLVNERLDDPEPLQLNTAGVPVADVRVYVSGAVNNPGVYPLDEGDRWIDALEAAGGARADADLSRVNLARRIQDEDQIVVPTLGQVGIAAASQGPLVNINTATEDELMSLRGIGEVRAANIVGSRTSDGPFASVQDLVDRDLIPRSVLEDISDQITVSP
jgi:competence protein ComEA